MIREQTLLDLMKEEDFEATFQEAVERKRKLEDLVQHPGYKVFEEQLQKQVERRFSEMIDFPSGIDSCIKSNYTIGEIAGIKLALGYAKLLVGAAENVIALHKHRESAERENEDFEEMKKDEF